MRNWRVISYKRSQHDDAGNPGEQMYTLVFEIPGFDQRFQMDAAEFAVLSAAVHTEWLPMKLAAKDGTAILLKLKNPIPVEAPDPWFDRWHGVIFVGHHPGIVPAVTTAPMGQCSDEVDVGWSFAAPVGHGGFPDHFFVGWKPLEGK
jgi:hypothetical protein